MIQILVALVPRGAVSGADRAMDAWRSGARVKLRASRVPDPHFRRQLAGHAVRLSRSPDPNLPPRAHAAQLQAPTLAARTSGWRGDAASPLPATWRHFLGGA